MKEVFNKIRSEVREQTDMTRDMEEEELRKIIDDTFSPVSDDTNGEGKVCNGDF